MSAASFGLSSALFDALRSAGAEQLQALDAELASYRAAFPQRRQPAPLLRDLLDAISEAASLRQEQAPAAEGLPAAEAAAAIVEAPEAALPVICCYCPDFDPWAPANAGASHGICWACADKMAADPAWKGGR